MAACRDRRGLRERAHRQWADPAIAARMRLGLAKTMWRKELPEMTREQRLLYEKLRDKHKIPRDEALKVIFK